MSAIAIIGGSGGIPLKANSALEELSEIATPYGSPSALLSSGEIAGREVVFLPRHGKNHSIAPHRINYRANLWALHQHPVAGVIALNTVGGICDSLAPGDIVIPDQLIDYTWGRESTFYDSDDGVVAHLEMSEPFSCAMRQLLANAANRCGIAVRDGGVYAATQGPRFETPAEIDRLDRDGCHIVGMTAMPEASLAGELGLSYGSLSVVVNHAAGRGAGAIDRAQISQALEKCSENLQQILQEAIAGAPESFSDSPLLLRP